MEEKTILLDLDGVCVQFLEGVLEELDKTHLKGTWEPGVTELSDFLGMTSDEYWEVIDKKGSKFWKDLKEYPWFWDMYKKLNNYGNIVFCTSPSLDANSSKGKVDWLQDRFGKKFRDFILTNKKHLCASQNTILIDDSLEQCENFIEWGGSAVLFPQRWNTNHAIENKIEYVLEKIKLWAAIN